MPFGNTSRLLYRVLRNDARVAFKWMAQTRLTKHRKTFADTAEFVCGNSTVRLEYRLNEAGTLRLRGRP